MSKANERNTKVDNDGFQRGSYKKNKSYRYKQAKYWTIEWYITKYDDLVSFKTMKEITAEPIKEYSHKKWPKFLALINDTL